MVEAQEERSVCLVGFGITGKRNPGQAFAHGMLALLCDLEACRMMGAGGQIVPRAVVMKNGLAKQAAEGRCSIQRMPCEPGIISAIPKSTVERPNFDEVVQKYYHRWDKSIPEDNWISEVQQAGLTSPFSRTSRISHNEILVHKIANWVLDRVLDG